MMNNVSRDLSYINKAKTNVKKYVDERLPCCNIEGSVDHITADFGNFQVQVRNG